MQYHFPLEFELIKELDLFWAILTILKYLICIVLHNDVKLFIPLLRR